jgi:hypothetical protein
MSKVAVLNDFIEYAEMAALLMRAEGHEVMTTIVPIDWEKILAFKPDVLVLSIYRREAAINRPIVDPLKDVAGYAALLETQNFPIIQVIPTLIIAWGVNEYDIPIKVNYDRFLKLPEEVKELSKVVEELSVKQKSIRKISKYYCPNTLCKSHLTYVKNTEDLFCPKCHTSIAVLGGGLCSYLLESKGDPIECKIIELLNSSSTLITT